MQIFLSTLLQSMEKLLLQHAQAYPVTFKKMAYIRIGSYTKKLNDHPSLQGQLWDRLRNVRFEDHHVRANLSRDTALQLLNYTTYFDISQIPQPTNAEALAYYMVEEGILATQPDGRYALTNLGALLFGKHLSDFERIDRKALRVIQYNGNNRLSILREETFDSGYITSFSQALHFISALLPSEEPIRGSVREKHTPYPPSVIREAIANALIHQDFTITGTGPVVELFANRIEITNPGTPLVDIYRIIDTPPKSRNEKLAALMRRLRMCEELGSGWDRMVIACEQAQLPAPKIETFADSSRVTLYAHKAFAEFSLEERLWACYLHACIQYVEGAYLTNRSLRERFGLTNSASAPISRLIKEAVQQNIIKPFDPTTAPRYMKYLPIWA